MSWDASGSGPTVRADAGELEDPPSEAEGCMAGAGEPGAPPGDEFVVTEGDKVTAARCCAVLEGVSHEGAMGCMCAVIRDTMEKLAAGVDFLCGKKPFF